jgi:hypothetical protein
VILHGFLLNPFIYVIEMSTLQSHVFNNAKCIKDPEYYAMVVRLAHSSFQICLGLFAFWLVNVLSNRAFLRVQ